MLKQKFAAAALAAAAILPMGIAAPAEAQRHGYDHRAQYQRGYDDAGYYNGYNRGYQDDYSRSYRGNDRRYYQDCRRSSGTTGLIAGGAGGSVLGGGTLGTILGAVGGGLLGKNLDQNHDRSQNYRNGC